MATIQTAIALYDGVTSPLKHMTRAMTVMVNSFEAMQTASEAAVDTSVFQTMREELALAEISWDSIESSIGSAARAQEDFTQGLRASGGAADGLMSKLQRLAAGAGLAFSLQKLIGMSDEVTGTTARLQLIVDDGGSVAELESRIMASANRSRAAYTDTAAVVSRLGILAGKSFSGTDEIIAFTELMNKNFIIAGASLEEQTSAMYQLTQAMASGRLQGDEFRSIIENAPLLATAIEEFMQNAGVEGTMKDWSSDGMLTADVIKQALFNSAEDIEARFARMPMTWSQVWTLASNAGITALRPLLSAINFLANNIEIIGPLVLGLGTAFLVFQVAAHWIQITDAVTKLYRGTVNFLSIGFGVLTGNTAAASAAMFQFNSAIFASPVFWIVAGILVLIGVLYASVAAFNKFTGSSVSATGIIIGAFAVLGAFLVNSFIVPAWNAFATFANFIRNLFKDPIAAVKMLFLDMADSVLGYIAKLAKGIEDLINSIPGVEIDITSGLDRAMDWVEEAKKTVKDESDWEEWVKRVNYIDYADAASAGDRLGRDLEQRLSDTFGFGSSAEDLLASINTNTADMKDSMEMSEEDLRYLRDIAERETINRFTTAEITVNQQNENHIASDMDIDGIMEAWSYDFAERLENSPEGVPE